MKEIGVFGLGAIVGAIFMGSWSVISFLAFAAEHCQ